MMSCKVKIRAVPAQGSDVILLRTALVIRDFEPRRFHVLPKIQIGPFRGGGSYIQLS